MCTRPVAFVCHALIRPQIAAFRCYVAWSADEYCPALVDLPLMCTCPDAHLSTAINHHLYPYVQFHASCSVCAKLLCNNPLCPSAHPPRVCPISFSLCSVSFDSAHARPSVCPPFPQPRFHVTSVTTVRCSNLREGRRPWLPPVPQHAPRSGAPALLLPPRLQSTLAAAAHPTRAAHCNRSGGRETWRGQHAARQG